MKISKIKILFFILAALILGSNSFAQEKMNLTIDQSIQIGLKNSKMIHSSKMKVMAAEAQYDEANTNLFPSLNLSASYTRLSPIPPFSVNTPFGKFDLSPSILDNYQLKLSLQQPLFTGFKILSSIKAAKYNASSVKQDFTKDEQELILNIKTSYWNLFKAHKIKSVIDENVDLVKAHLDDVQNFFKQGLATRNDVLKVEVQLSEAKLSQIDAKNSVQLAIVNLDNVLGLPLSTDIQVQDSVEMQRNDVKELDDLISEAMRNRPELKSLDYKVKASEANVTVAKSNWYPQVFLAGNYYYSKPNQRILPTQNEFKDTWDVSVGLQFDLWNWGANGDKTTQAEAQLEQAKDGLHMFKDGITLEVTQSYYNTVKAQEKVMVSKQSVNQAEENYRVTNDKYKQGLTLNSELLDAEVALRQAKTNYVQSLVDYELAIAKLHRAIGLSEIKN